MAKKQETMELTVESLMSAGYSKEDAEAIVGANESGGTGLPFPILKINYDPEIPEFAKKGEWVADVQKDEDGEITNLTNFGEEINLVILASGYQYSKYDSTTNKSSVSSNIFPMSESKKAIDLKTGKYISELKKYDTDNKIKFQEVALVLASSKKQPEPKPYIIFIKGAFMYTLGQCRKPLKNKGNVMFTLSFSLEQKKKGATKYFVVDESSFIAKPRSLADIKAGAETIPAYIKAYNDWVAGINSGGSAKDAKEEVPPFDEDNDDDDDVRF